VTGRRRPVIGGFADLASAEQKVFNESIPTLVGILSWGLGCVRPTHAGTFPSLSTYHQTLRIVTGDCPSPIYFFPNQYVPITKEKLSQKLAPLVIFKKLPKVNSPNMVTLLFMFKFRLHVL
jgi:hypothetical protein